MKTDLRRVPMFVVTMTSKQKTMYQEIQAYFLKKVLKQAYQTPC